MGIVPLKQIEYGVYGVLILISHKPYSISLRGTILGPFTEGNFEQIQESTVSAHKSALPPLTVRVVIYGLLRVIWGLILVR